MSVMTVVSESSVFGPFESGLFDCDGIALNVGDGVVEAVMTKDGVQCPKMSALPTVYEIVGFGVELFEFALEGALLPGSTVYGTEFPVLSGLDRIEEYVLVRRGMADSSYEYGYYHMSELAWVSDGMAGLEY